MGTRPGLTEVFEKANGFALRLVERFPRGVAFFLLATAALLVSSVLVGTIGLVIAFAFTVSLEASKMVLWLCVGLSIAVAIPLFMQVERNTLMRRSTRRLLTKAQAGNKEAAWRLVDGYLNGGYGLTKDPSQANWWLQQLASSGDSDAAYLLHEHYRDGIGIYRNITGAMEWLNHAATLGHEKATALVNKEGA
jgi:TPR repeat protein